MEDFGFALRVARERRGLTQMEGMRQTGINNKTLSGCIHRPKSTV